MLERWKKDDSLGLNRVRTKEIKEGFGGLKKFIEGTGKGWTGTGQQQDDPGMGFQQMLEGSGIPSNYWQYIGSVMKRANVPFEQAMGVLKRIRAGGDYSDRGIRNALK